MNDFMGLLVGGIMTLAGLIGIFVKQEKERSKERECVEERRVKDRADVARENAAVTQNLALLNQTLVHSNELQVRQNEMLSEKVGFLQVDLGKLREDHNMLDLEVFYIKNAIKPH